MRINFLFLGAIAAAIGFAVTQRSSTAPAWKLAGDAEKYLPQIAQAEKTYGIPADILARMAYQESRFRPEIIDGTLKSSAGAVGILQIVPRFHPSIGENGAKNPWIAIPYAAQFLKDLRNRTGSWKLAVAAYNAGLGNVTKYNGIPPFKETQNYVSQIFADLPSTYV